MVSGISPSPDVSRRSLEDSSPRGSRKVSTYGGSRAWSEDEEAYLLEARQCKTPYKHIASHLQKTELACRLHFHQLAYGTKRKRRSPSASSAATTQESRNPSVPAPERGHASQKSMDSTGSRASVDPVSGLLQPTPVMRVSAISPPSSPSPAQRRRLARSESPLHNDDCLHVPLSSAHPSTATIPATSTFTPFPGPPSPFPALPNLSVGHFPHTSSHACPLFSPTASSYTCPPSLLPPDNIGNPAARPRSAYLPRAGPDFLPAPEPSSNISTSPLSFSHRSRLDLTFSSSNSAPPSLSIGPRPPSPNSIDPYRLSGIYGRNRQAFWNSVAREYGGNVSPTALEAAFLRQSAGSPTGSLPTPPNRSPILSLDAQLAKDVSRERRDSAGSGNDAGPSCSIASLLTEDREVWQRHTMA